MDCFGGSFSTGLACLELERDFIGIEIDEEIFASAKKRLEEKGIPVKDVLDENGGVDYLATSEKELEFVYSLLWGD